MIKQRPDKIFFLPGTDLFLKTSSQKILYILIKKVCFTSQAAALIAGEWIKSKSWLGAYGFSFFKINFAKNR